MPVENYHVEHKHPTAQLAAKGIIDTHIAYTNQVFHKNLCLNSRDTIQRDIKQKVADQVRLKQNLINLNDTVFGFILTDDLKLYIMKQYLTLYINIS